MSMNVGGVAKKGGSDTAEISHASGSNFPRSQPLNGQQRGFKLSHAAKTSAVFESAVRFAPSGNPIHMGEISQVPG